MSTPPSASTTSEHRTHRLPPGELSEIQGRVEENRQRVLPNPSIINSMAENKTESRASRTIREVFASGRPLTYVRSSEEQRVARVLREVGEGIGATVWTWSQTEGNGAETA